MQYETKILTTKYQKPDAYGALSMPVYYTAAFEFESAKAMGDAFCGRSMAPSYARIANPTVTYLEERVRQLTGAASVTALNTGMAAIHYALTAVSAAGLNIVASKHLFGNSVSLIRDTLGNFGVEPRFVDFTKPEEVAAQIDDKTCALFFEIITNPQLFVADIRKLADIAHQAGVPLIADTTIVPFSTFHAVDFGVDIEVVSSTKYISGGGTGSPAGPYQEGRQETGIYGSCKNGTHHQSWRLNDTAGGLYGNPRSRHPRHPFPSSGRDHAMVGKTMSTTARDQARELYWFGR